MQTTVAFAIRTAIDKNKLLVFKNECWVAVVTAEISQCRRTTPLETLIDQTHIRLLLSLHPNAPQAGTCEGAAITSSTGSTGRNDGLRDRTRIRGNR